MPQILGAAAGTSPLASAGAMAFSNSLPLPFEQSNNFTNRSALTALVVVAVFSANRPEPQS